MSFAFQGLAPVIPDTIFFFLLEAVAELGMVFSQMYPNFWRYYLTLWVRAREEGLKFSLIELKQLCILKRNSGFLGTIFLSPRAGNMIVDGIPGQDDCWKEKFFVFKPLVISTSTEFLGNGMMT